MTVNINGKLFDLSTPKIMGILNTTPDSFYAESRVNSTDSIVSRARKMLHDGAQIVDIGGYSSRPGAVNISVSEEKARVIPAIKAISEAIPELIISVDTFRAEVAEEAIQHGASIINDISGFSIDSSIIQVAAKYKVPYILMHMRGNVQNMMDDTVYDSVFNELMAYFSGKIDQLKKAGVKDIILDPGFGFSKTIEQNYELLEKLDGFQFLNLPILVGLSRKSMIYKKLNCSPSDDACLQETIRLHSTCISKGANIIRVHDTKEHSDLLKALV